MIEKLTDEQFALYVAMKTSESAAPSIIIEKAEKYYEWLESKREQLKSRQ